MTPTDYLAAYGAIVATAVLVWDIAKWIATGPRLKATARCHITYADSPLVNQKIDVSGMSGTLVDYCHIEITNIGDRPTTVISIEGTHRVKRGDAQLTSNSVCFVPHEGKRLPRILGPGELWSARLEMDNLRSLAAHGRPVIRIKVSHKAEKISVWPNYPV